MALYATGNGLALYGLFRVILLRRTLGERVAWVRVVAGLIGWFALLMVVDILTSTFSRRLPLALGTIVGSGLAVGLLLAVRPPQTRKAAVWMLGSVLVVGAVNLPDHGG